MQNILKIKKTIKSKEDFERLVLEIKKFRNLNYSKVEKNYLTP